MYAGFVEKEQDRNVLNNVTSIWMGPKEIQNIKIKYEKNMHLLPW